MPEFTPLVVSILSATILCEIVAAALMAKNGYSSGWRSLLSMLVYRASCDLFMSGILLFVRNQDIRAEAYFYAFWIAKIGETFLQFWVLWQIAEKLLPRSIRVQRIGMAGFGLAAAANLALSAYCSVHASLPFYLRITRFVWHAETAASLAWCLTFLLVTFGSGFIGILWRTEMLVVASGFALHVALRTLALWSAVLRIPDSASHVLSASDIGFLLSLLVWISYFRSKRNEGRIDRELAADIRGELQALRAMDV